MAQINYKVGDQIIVKPAMQHGGWFQQDHGPYTCMGLEHGVFGLAVRLDRSPRGHDKTTTLWGATSFEKYVEPKVSLSQAAFGYDVGDQVMRKKDAYKGSFNFDNDPGPYTVVGFNGRSVTLNRGPKGSWSYDRHWEAKNFEKYVAPPAIPNPKSPHIVVLKNRHGKLQPSTFPFIHQDEQSALTEAKRLANVSKGDTFVVFRAIGEAKAQVPVVPPATVEMY